MQKIKMTKKAIMTAYDDIIEIGYCDAQHLLRASHASFYTCGVYGWNADVYDLGRVGSYGYDVAICTGYRPFGNIKPKYEIVREYDKRAEEILKNNKWCDWDKTQVLLWDLVNEFVKVVIE